MLTLLSDLFSQYIASWQSADEERRLQEAEEASLYRYKARSHGDDMTEEEKDQADLKRKFPSFEQVLHGAYSDYLFKYIYWLNDNIP